MASSKILVVYYSRTGNTRKVAEYLSKRLDADLEEIKDSKNRGGLIGWLTAGRDAGRKTLTRISEPKHNPVNYDLVVIGSPVWNDTVSTPIRTYINEQSQSIRSIALFTTQDSDETNAIPDMEEMLGRKPQASIQLQRKHGVNSENYDKQLEEYVTKLKTLDPLEVV